MTNPSFHAAPVAIVASLLACAPAVAAEPPAPVASYVSGELTAFLGALAPLRAELNAANAARQGWSGFNDDWKAWTPETAAANTESYNHGEYLWSARKDRAFRTLHTDTPAAKALKAFQDASGGKIVEFFITDARGGNVCQTALTSDWFQGDEEKFSAVANKPAEAADRAAPFYAEPKRDDTVGQTGIQVSIPLFDGDKFIGVAVALVIVEKL